MVRYFLTSLVRAALRAELMPMEARLNSKLTAIQNAEDRLGVTIANAVAQNKSNMDKLAVAIKAAQSPTASSDDDDALDKILADTVAHATALEAAFPAPTDAAKVPEVPIADGALANG